MTFFHRQLALLGIPRWVRRTSRGFAVVLWLLVVFAACGSESSDADFAAQLEGVEAQAIADVEEAQAAADQALQAEAAAQNVARVQATEHREAMAALDQRVADLTTELETTKNDLASSQSSESRVVDELAEVTASLTATERRAAAAETEVETLRAKYDLEIRAEAQIAWDAEVTSACADAANGESSIGRYVDHTDELAIIGTGEELVEQVAACAEPLRARSEDERLSAECERGSADAVTKDPDGLAGNCYVMFVVPWQWDSRTGACNFLGSWDGSNLGTRRYRYDGDGLFRADDDVCEEDLDGADQDDLLQVWATLDGPYRYDTAAGGTNEIPDFAIRKAVLVSKG